MQPFPAAGQVFSVLSVKFTKGPLPFCTGWRRAPDQGPPPLQFSRFDGMKRFLCDFKPLHKAFPKTAPVGFRQRCPPMLCAAPPNSMNAASSHGWRCCGKAPLPEKKRRIAHPLPKRFFLLIPTLFFRSPAPNGASSLSDCIPLLSRLWRT